MGYGWGGNGGQLLEPREQRKQARGGKGLVGDCGRGGGLQKEVSNFLVQQHSNFTVTE